MGSIRLESSPLSAPFPTFQALGGDSGFTRLAVRQARVPVTAIPSCSSQYSREGSPGPSRHGRSNAPVLWGKALKACRSNAPVLGGKAFRQSSLGFPGAVLLGSPAGFLGLLLVSCSWWSLWCSLGDIWFVSAGLVVSWWSLAGLLLVSLSCWSS